LAPLEAAYVGMPKTTTKKIQISIITETSMVDQRATRMKLGWD